MSEEELKAKAEELEKREGDLKEREEALNEREAKLAVHEADASNIAKTLTEEYEKKLATQKQVFEERLQQRDEVIRQLASGESAAADDDNPFTQLNKRRIAQKAA